MSLKPKRIYNPCERMRVIFRIFSSSWAAREIMGCEHGDDPTTEWEERAASSQGRLHAKVWTSRGARVASIVTRSCFTTPSSSINFEEASRARINYHEIDNLIGRATQIIMIAATHTKIRGWWRLFWRIGFKHQIMKLDSIISQSVEYFYDNVWAYIFQKFVLWSPFVTEIQ